MNHYGAIAEDHWKKHLPSRYAALEDPETFFNSLGNQIQEMVQNLEDSRRSLEQPELNTMEHLERIGRLKAIRKSAEEQAFADLIWPEGSTGEQTSEDSTDPRDWTQAKRDEWLKAQGLVNLPQGGLMPSDLTHPLWVGWDPISDEPIDLPQHEWEAWKADWRTWMATLPNEVALLN